MLENQNTEFKREYTDDIKKAVVAFANSDGGNIFIGINDDGEKIGVKNADETLLKITNLIRDTIRPDVTIFTTHEILTENTCNIIKVTVQSGTAKPYYLAAKGIRPEGVYVRQGASSVPASEAAILKMIQEASGYNYEQERSLNQELTFNKAMEVFAKQNIPFEELQKKTLGLIGIDGMYTNLAQLVSDQCQHSIKIAVFEGVDKLNFKDRTEFTGSVFNQMEQAYRYINQYNRTRSEFNGLYRQDMRDYPLEALREALLNAIVHRDYAYSGSTLISLFDDRIEFLNIGGLVKGITYDDMMLGVSMTRNQKLANIFYRLELIEAYGTGLLKIRNAYGYTKGNIKIEVSNNAFKITLPNMNTEHEQKSYRVKEDHEIYGLNSTEQKIINLLQQKGSIKREDIETNIGLSLSGAIKCIKALLDKGIIVKVRNGRNISYRIK